MSTSAKAVRVDENSLWVDLADGRAIGVPLALLPRLLHASPQQRLPCENSRGGLHWEALDEDISINRLLAGHGDMSQAPRKFVRG